ncbi:MAG: class I SAM-dependent DNA methyltransferase, partial [Ignavibacteriales bacterium]|nr:class I SAM-dependent DNA methyltransferase [Ignavibacteriales bacterium]
MTTQEIVNKLWNLCDILWDDGITYHQYVTELTYILFLKMAKETGTETSIPKGYRWDDLLKHGGIELKKFYVKLLAYLGTESEGRIKEIYANAHTNIDEPKNLEKLIKNIDQLDWYSAKTEGLGDLYEGLLQKNATEKKSGAGQYFTPRCLIRTMVELIAPRPGERCFDPACGTFGFMIMADRYVRLQTENNYKLSAKGAKFQTEEAFTGCELVQDTHRLALMNAILHGMEGEITLGDSLSLIGQKHKNHNVILT